MLETYTVLKGAGRLWFSRGLDRLIMLLTRCLPSCRAPCVEDMVEDVIE